MRIPQKEGTKGSLKWIQLLVNDNSSIINQEIQRHINANNSFINTEWVSPKKEDGFAEYRDKDFLEILGLERFHPQLQDFWPERGPQWDALGKFKEDCYFLVEAKANIPEILSTSQAKSKQSKSKIESSITQTQKFLDATSGQNWLAGFYQYANRISHLYFLRELCGVNAYLIFVYFCNDCSHIHTTQEQWNGAIKLQKQLMSLNRHKMQKYVVDIFIDVNEIKIEQGN